MEDFPLQGLFSGVDQYQPLWTIWMWGMNLQKLRAKFWLENEGTRNDDVENHISRPHKSRHPFIASVCHFMLRKRRLWRFCSILNNVPIYLLDIHKYLDIHGASESVGRFLVFSQLFFWVMGRIQHSRFFSRFLMEKTMDGQKLGLAAS